MRLYRIIKSFVGSQDGFRTQLFKEGTTELLSHSLVKAVAGAGFIEPCDPANRDTKITAPAETKIVQPSELKLKKKR
jgi:hypothetical protein